MTSYYKLIRKEEVLPQLKNNILEDRKWRDRLRDKFEICDYFITEGDSGNLKTIFFSEMPPIFILSDLNEKIISNSPITYLEMVSKKKNIKLGNETGEHLLVCNLDKVNPEQRERILTTLEVLPELTSEADGTSLESFLGTFYTEKDSIYSISPEYVSKNFPLTYEE